jgi:K+-transporting ATPase ATPase C chain
MIKQIKISFYFTALSTIGLGVIYPALLSGVALLIPPKPPSLLLKSIEQDDLFHGRPSMSGGSYSGGSNLSLTSPELAKQVDERLKRLTKDAPGVLIPRDLLFASGSGYDPDISIEAARIQINRIEKTGKLNRDKLENLIRRHTHTKALGFIGADYVNVVDINQALSSFTSDNPPDEPETSHAIATKN